MNETIIKKLESRMTEAKAWRLENSETGHFLDVSSHSIWKTR